MLGVALVLAGAKTQLPASPSVSQIVWNGLLGLGIAILIVTALTFLVSLVLAPYQQRNALRKLNPPPGVSTAEINPDNPDTIYPVGGHLPVTASVINRGPESMFHATVQWIDKHGNPSPEGTFPAVWVNSPGNDRRIHENETVRVYVAVVSQGSRIETDTRGQYGRLIWMLATQEPPTTCATEANTGDDVGVRLSVWQDGIPTPVTADLYPIEREGNMPGLAAELEMEDEVPS